MRNRLDLVTLDLVIPGHELLGEKPCSITSINGVIHSIHHDGVNVTKFFKGQVCKMEDKPLLESINSTVQYKIRK